MRSVLDGDQHLGARRETGKQNTKKRKMTWVTHG